MVWAMTFMMMGKSLHRPGQGGHSVFLLFCIYIYIYTRAAFRAFTPFSILSYFLLIMGGWTTLVRGIHFGGWGGGGEDMSWNWDFEVWSCFCLGLFVFWYSMFTWVRERGREALLLASADGGFLMQLFLLGFEDLSTYVRSLVLFIYMHIIMTFFFIPFSYQ